MARTTDFIYSRINDSLPARGKFLFSGPRMEYVLYTVVGGGTAGSVLASRLAEDANRTILVIEAGGFPTTDPNIEVPIFADIVRNSDEFNWRYTTVPQKHACKAHVDQVLYSSQTKSPEPAVTALTTGLKL